MNKCWPFAQRTTSIFRCPLPAALWSLHVRNDLIARANRPSLANQSKNLPAKASCSSNWRHHGKSHSLPNSFRHPIGHENRMFRVNRDSAPRWARRWSVQSEVGVLPRVNGETKVNVSRELWVTAKWMRLDKRLPSLLPRAFFHREAAPASFFKWMVRAMPLVGAYSSSPRANGEAEANGSREPEVTASGASRQTFTSLNFR